MGGQAAEQIIAGVVLSERLAVTMYGAIHRAQWSGQRDLRGLVVDPKMLAESSFRVALTDAKAISTVTALEHANIVPTVAVESGGPDVVVVTRGVGRYVTVQDLISAARANRAQSGKLTLPVAAAIGRSVIEALAAAHEAGVVHGAVHPRSVLVDEDGAVRLGDFVVGRALTTAVAQGADSSLWRGLSGYLAPELVVGEDPTPGCDVFAVGAMLFTMLSGEVPPGTLHVTPAVERLVQRALDTDVTRRYKSAKDLLDNLLEAFEDDRWEIAARGDVIKAAGLSGSDGNVDEATEDLLASLGTSAGGVQLTPIRPSIDIRAEAVAARHQKTPTGANKLDALLSDLDDDSKEHTAIDDIPGKRDPISEIIKMEPRAGEAIVQGGTSVRRKRVPSLDDPDDDDDSHTPLPPPQRESDLEIARSAPRTATNDERAALDALSGLDEPVRRMSSAAEKLEQVAKRVEAAAQRVETNSDTRRASSPAIAPPLVDPVPDLDFKPPRLKSRALGIISLLVVIGGSFAFYRIYKSQQEANAAQAKKDEEKRKEAERLEAALREDLPDPGAIRVTSTPPQAGVWLKLGRTPLDTVLPRSGLPHEIRFENLDGYKPLDTQVLAVHWSKDNKAKLAVQLETAKGKKTKLPAMPPKPQLPPGFVPIGGPARIETTPPGAEAWLYVGMTDEAKLQNIQAGLPYELRVLKDGYLPGFITITPDEWRDNDPKTPINRAKKKALLERGVELVPQKGS